MDEQVPGQLQRRAGGALETSFKKHVFDEDLFHLQGAVALRQHHEAGASCPGFKACPANCAEQVHGKYLKMA